MKRHCLCFGACYNANGLITTMINLWWSLLGGVWSMLLIVIIGLLLWVLWACYFAQRVHKNSGRVQVETEKSSCFNRREISKFPEVTIPWHERTLKSLKKWTLSKLIKTINLSGKIEFGNKFLHEEILVWSAIRAFSAFCGFQWNITCMRNSHGKQKQWQTERLALAQVRDDKDWC